MKARPSVRDLRRTILCFAVLCTCTSISAAALAQATKPAPSSNVQPSVMAEARARFEEGIKQAEVGDHEGARLKFNQAWALLKSPAILYNLARAEELSGHPVEALEHYRQFAALPPDPKVTDAQRQRAAEGITELAKNVGQIRVDAPMGARISVDGHAIAPGSTDPIPVTPGKHVVEAIGDGKVKSVTIDCPAGTITTAKLREDEGPREMGLPLSALPTMETDKSRVERTSPSGSPKNDTPRFWTGGRVAGLVIVAGGLVMLGGGLIAHQMAATSNEEADRVRNGLPEPRASACNDPANSVPCAELQTHVANLKQLEKLRSGFFIASSVLVAAGGLLFLVSSPKGEPDRGAARVVPFLSARDAGLAVLGRF